VAYRRWGQLDGEESLLAWLRGITMRTGQNYRRAARRRAHRFTSTDEADVEHVLLLEPTPAETLEKREDRLWLEQALARLDEKCREAIIMTRLEGRSAAEVSRITGLSANTVASRLRSALLALRRQVEAGRADEFDPCRTLVGRGRGDRP
jgi:RNA polymerase sigma-70 factor (ECF subfamily)